MPDKESLSNSTDIAVSCSDLCCSFSKPELLAIDNISLEIQAGVKTALVGPDGAGKTTFLRMICGLLSPAKGRLSVLGMDVKKYAREIQNKISYMPQRFGLYEDLSVAENMNLYADLHAVPKNVRKDRFDKLLHMTDLTKFTDRLAGRLSGGMKQKLALACTLVRSPKLLLLDEPSVGVDPLSRRDLWIIIEQMLKDEHLSVIVSTAYMDEAERCSTVFVFQNGQVLTQGTPDELKQLTKGLCFSIPIQQGSKAREIQTDLMERHSFIMDAVPLGERVRFTVQPEYRSAVCTDISEAREEEPRMEDSFMFILKRHTERTRIADSSTIEEQSEEFKFTTEGKNLSYTPLDDTAKHGEIIIEVRDLVRKFGSFLAVASTSFFVRKGEVFGLLGPNGAGKTTTFRMLCGLLPATSGFLQVAGVNLRTAAAQARSKIGYVAQKFSLYGNLTVQENLSFFGGVYGISPFALPKRVREVMVQFGLKGHENDISGNMPGGFKQRLSMAAGLIHKPEILFLDEPTSGIDPLARRAFWKKITELSAQGTTIVITTHFMEEAEYCDRMLIQDAGKVLALGTPAEIRYKAGNCRTMDEAFIKIVENAREDQI